MNDSFLKSINKITLCQLSFFFFATRRRPSFCEKSAKLFKRLLFYKQAWVKSVEAIQAWFVHAVLQLQTYKVRYICSSDATNMQVYDESDKLILVSLVVKPCLTWVGPCPYCSLHSSFWVNLTDCTLQLTCLHARAASHCKEESKQDKVKNDMLGCWFSVLVLLYIREHKLATVWQHSCRFGLMCLYFALTVSQTSLSLGPCDSDPRLLTIVLVCTLSNPRPKSMLLGMACTKLRAIVHMYLQDLSSNQQSL